MVHFVNGPTRWNPVCFGQTSLPHNAVHQFPRTSGRYFTSGNERTPIDINPQVKGLARGTGYHLTATDTFSYLVELMNMNMEDKVVYLTMTYDILEGPLPGGWENVKVCDRSAPSGNGLSKCLYRVFGLMQNPVGVRKSNLLSKQDRSQFKASLKSQISKEGSSAVLDTYTTARYSRPMQNSLVNDIFAGDVSVDINATSQEKVCTTSARYAETPEYRFEGKNMGNDKVAVDHISSMTPCQPVVEHLTATQNWSVTGTYDYDKRAGNIDRGKQGEVTYSARYSRTKRLIRYYIMAIGLVWVAVPASGVLAPKLQ